MQRTIFVMCMLDSIHSARWLTQFRGSEHKFVLFPTSAHRKLHPRISELLNETANFELVRFGRWLGLPISIVDRLARGTVRGAIARAFIALHKPDIVHAIEFQGAGYAALLALQRSKPSKCKLIVTNWGSDIYWFHRFPTHKARIQELLKLADYYSAECERDISLARELGFEGGVLPVIPNAGGLPDSALEKPLVSPDSRKTILVKGYDGWVGRAVVALNALAGMRDEISQYEVVVYSSNRRTIAEALKVRREAGLDISTYKIGELSHSEMLALFAKAKIYIGLSESDGISTSLLEAMAMGAIPVQTSTSCCEEWFKQTGVSVHSIDIGSVQRAIRKGLALANDAHNAETNRGVIRQRAKASNVSAIASTFYDIS